jgi:diguanylate cyclase (GGDEF)-like protein/PAS domain S-box-containing protein
MAARRKAPPRAKKASIKRHVGAGTGRVRSSLSSDWYWEQDAALRFTRVEVQTGSPGEQELARRLLGKLRWETGIEIEGGWEAHRAVLKARAPFRDVLMWREFEDGHRRYVSVSGEPVFDSKGRFAGYRGVGRDVTEQKRGEQLLRLEHSVTLSLADAASEPDALRTALRAICETEGWDYAEFWKLDEAAGVLRRHVHWAMPGVPEAASFAASSPELAVGPGEGLVGTVWKSGEPLWIADTAADPRTLRRSLVAETGLRGTLKVPVSLAGRVVGVINCFCRRIRPPDQRLLQALKVVAAQIGHFLQRAQAEAQVRESEERFRRTFELAGSGVAHVGLDRRFIRVNRRLCEMLGYAEHELIGRTGRQLSHPDDLDVINAQRPQLYAGEIDAVRIEKRYLRKDGSTIWVALTVTLERDAAGKPQYEITVYDDIDARKAAESALRDSEGRFRSLTHLSSDWFWEQDVEYRFTRLEGRHVTGGDVRLRQQLMGRPRWESGLEAEGGWDAHRAALDARQPFDDLLMWRTMPDGSMRYVRVSGEPVFAADGSFAGYRGVGRDVTDEKRAEQILRLEHDVARALSEAESGSAGLNAVMRAVCETEGWACGRYFGVDEATGLLRYREGWCVAGVEAFLERSRGMSFPRGEGLPGMVWESGELQWSADTATDARVRHKSLVQGTGIRGTFAFAVVSEGKTLGVLSFSSQSVRKPDERLVRATRVIGSQVGQFLRRKQAEESLRESEARFRSLTQMSSDFFWETDAQHRVSQLVHGPNSEPLIGRDAIGKATWELPSVHPDEAGWAAHRAGLDRHEPFRDFEFARVAPDRTTRYFSVSGEPYFAADGGFLGYRGVGRDITGVVLARERIASLAYSDALTGLANRTSLAPALAAAVERTHRRGSKLAGVFIDLDGFKQINDLYGHDAGDALLVEVARRLRASLRASDPVARLGGDEFFVVLEDLHDNAPAERVADKLLSAILRPYELGPGKQAGISASIGISLYPDDAGDAATLMKHADAAMYSAKQAGKNAYRFFKAGAAANDPPAAAGKIL